MHYHTLSVIGRDTLTTHTDYANPYPSIIQTTSYNFTRTETMSEICVGIVKAVPLHLKNPAQHAANFKVKKNYIMYFTVMKV